MNNNFIHTFGRFLNLINARVTKTSATRYLLSHPDEGSIMAYTDALNHFKIENAVAEITLKDLEDLPTPLITLLQEDGGTFTIIKSVQDDTIIWLNKEKRWIQTKLEEFSENWSGIVLFAETDKESGETDFRLKRNAEIFESLRIPFALSLTGILLLAFIFTSNTVTAISYALLFLKLLGMVIVSLLFIKSIDSTNELVNKICTAGSKLNCQSILDSPAAKITPWFSWSDAGLIYFFGSFFSLLLSIKTQEALNTFLSIQFIFCVIALLFSSYSLYYQGLKAKLWCTLCLGVVATFLLEAIVLSVYFSNNGFIFEITSVLEVLMGFSAPLVFLLLLKNIILKAQETEKLRKDLNKLKTNPKIFESLMADQKQMPKIPTDLPLLALGQEDARHTITLVSNPKCTPCSKMHLKIEKLLQQDHSIKCEVIFTSNLDRNDVGGLFVRKIFSLPQELRVKAMHDWFKRDNKNYEVWNTNYMEYNESPGLSNIQLGHNYWSDEAEVKRTPTLFVNGRLLPDLINVEDLSRHLSHANTPIPDNGFANHKL